VSSQAVPTDRYGAPAPWRRWALIAASVTVAAVFGGWLAWTALDAATPEVESELIGFDVVDEHAATADVRVDFGSDDVVADCRLRAVAADGSAVGELTFTATPDDGTRYEPTVRTERRADRVDLVGCTTPDQTRPR
jgi:hypothetical protein